MIKENVIIKQDTTENWNKAKNFIPKEGEIIKYTDTDNLKRENDKTLINNLPFLSQYSDILNNNILEIQEG